MIDIIKSSQHKYKKGYQALAKKRLGEEEYCALGVVGRESGLSFEDLYANDEAYSKIGQLFPGVDIDRVWYISDNNKTWGETINSLEYWYEETEYWRAVWRNDHE
jgi:hypothetical protein